MDRMLSSVQVPENAPAADANEHPVNRLLHAYEESALVASLGAEQTAAADDVGGPIAALESLGDAPTHQT
jgi:hypothetical protein